MIVGETIRLRHVETQLDPVTEGPVSFDASAPAVLITAPDGTQATPAVTLAYGSASDPDNLSTVFSFLLTPALGGPYKCILSYLDRDGETISRPLTFFATWTDPSALLQTRLQATVPPEVFEPEFASVSRMLLARFTCLGNLPGSNAPVGIYRGLLGDDQAFFDEAATLAVLARIAGPIRTGGELSDVVAKTVGDVEYRYGDGTREGAPTAPGDYGAGPGGYGGVSERSRWLRESAEALGKVSCIRQYFQAQRSAFSPFGLAGLTRQQKAMGGGHTLLGQVVDLLTNDYYLEQDYDYTGCQ